MTLRSVLFVLLLLLLTAAAYAQEFTVVGTSPAAGDSSVALQATVRFTFSAPLDTTARFGDQGPLAFFTISPPDSIQVDSVTYSDDLTEARFHVRQTDETDFVWILTGAKRQAGDPLRPAHVLDYSTADTRGRYEVSGLAYYAIPLKRGDETDDPAVILLSNNPLVPGDHVPVVDPQHVVAAAVGDSINQYGAAPFRIRHVHPGTYWPSGLYDQNLNGVIESFEYGFGWWIENDDAYANPDSLVVEAQDIEGLRMDFASRRRGSTESAAELPGIATLLPNYPNPFNPTTTLPFRLEHPARLRLTVHDLLGRRVATVAEGFYLPGDHAATWDAGALPSGLYGVRLEGEAFVLTRQVLLVK